MNARNDRRKYFFIRRQIGLTLLEIMLVLAVSASVLLLGIRQYQQFQNEKNIMQVQQNVDQVFIALGHYYQAYCGRGLTLDPSQSPANPFPMSPTTLVSNGFLAANWNAISVPFALSYVSQLNLKTLGTQNVYACWNFGTYTCGSLSTLPSGTSSTNTSVYLWTVQVAVQMSSVAQARAYKAVLNANCISSLSGSTVTPCASSSNNGVYVVWERLPTMTSPDLSSNLWMSVPQLKQFNLQYTHDQMYELSNGPNATSGTTGAQPYLCGG